MLHQKLWLKAVEIYTMGHTKLLILSSDLLEYKDTVKEIVDYLTTES